MPFQTDHTWTPSTYRQCYELWAVNAPKHDGPIMPRVAHSKSPRHASLSTTLRSLLAWRAATTPEPPVTTSWMRYDVHPDNDNEFDDTPAPQLLDSEIEIRPSISELQREWRGTKERPVAYRDVSIGRLAVGGNISHGVQLDVPDYAASETSGERARRRDRRIVTRVAQLEFGNGEQQERCIVLRMGEPVIGRVRVPAGALVRYRGYKPVDNFRVAKGNLSETNATVGIGGHNPGAGLCPDPLEAAEWAAILREAVGPETAQILDLAILAANFREIGEAGGLRGKHAEREGKATVIKACKRLDAILGAENDNVPFLHSVPDSTERCA